MANKNTLRKRRSMEATNKRGVAINSENRGRFSPRLSPEMMQKVGEIRSQTRRIYG